MSTTEQGPMTVNELINRLKMLPGDWRIEINTSDGPSYIDALEISDNCEVAFIMKKIPSDNE